MSQSKRIAWVDYAKAIAIIGIIVGHFAPYFSHVLTWAHPLCELMYSFHVAAFFLLSGYTTKQGIMPARKIASFAKTCFLPYLVAGILSIAVCMVFTPNKNPVEWEAALLYASGAYNGELVAGYPFGAAVIGAVWFLPALFFGKLISTSISKLPSPVQLLITAVLFVIGYKTASILFLPLDIQQAMCASWWITCGMVMSKTKLFTDRGIVRTSIVAISAVVGIAYMALLWLEIWREPMYCNSTYPNGLLDMLGTTCATVFIMLLAQLCEMLPKIMQRGIDWVGKNTLPIFCWHAVSIAPGVFLSDWLMSFITGGARPIIVFVVSLFADIVFSFGMTWISSKVPGLRAVFFPARKKAQTAGNAPTVSLVPDTRTQLIGNGSASNNSGNNSSSNGDDDFIIDNDFVALFGGVDDMPTEPQIPSTTRPSTSEGQRSSNTVSFAAARSIHEATRPDLVIDVERQQRVFHISNDVASTSKSAEQVILNAKRAQGYTTPEHKTRRRRDSGGHYRRVSGDPSKHLK